MTLFFRIWVSNRWNRGPYDRRSRLCGGLSTRSLYIKFSWANLERQGWPESSLTPSCEAVKEESSLEGMHTPVWMRRIPGPGYKHVQFFVGSVACDIHIWWSPLVTIISKISGWRDNSPNSRDFLIKVPLPIFHFWEVDRVVLWFCTMKRIRFAKKVLFGTEQKGTTSKKGDHHEAQNPQTEELRGACLTWESNS